jgi:hypothetical protein
MKKFRIKNPIGLFIDQNGEWDLEKNAIQFEKYSDATDFYSTFQERKFKFHRIEKIETV